MTNAMCRDLRRNVFFHRQVENVSTIGVISRDPIFVFLGVHPASFDDAQANADDVVIVHWVACHACVGCADEEVHCKGFKSVSRMPVGGHFLAIFFTIFGRCFEVPCDEPIEHV